MSAHNTGILFIISAPSGTGKTSLVKALIDSLSNIVVSVSHTTRPVRPGELDGINYHFVSVDAFKKMFDEHEFLETAEVYGNFYGTSKQCVRKTLDQGKDVILEIEWQGARQVRKLFPEAVSIFILPPNKAALKQRLESRGQDNAVIIAKRLELASQEVNCQGEYNYLIVNDQFEVALSDLRSIVRAEHSKQGRQEKRLEALLNELTS